MPAAVAATVAKGQPAGSLQGCQALSAFFRRQPVSAISSTRCGCALGSGRLRSARVTWLAPSGSCISQTDTGKSEGLESDGSLAVGRSATVPAPTRSAMRLMRPSTTICGHTLAPAGAPAGSV